MKRCFASRRSTASDSSMPAARMERCGFPTDVAGWYWPIPQRPPESNAPAAWLSGDRPARGGSGLRPASYSFGVTNALVLTELLGAVGRSDTSPHRKDVVGDVAVGGAVEGDDLTDGDDVVEPAVGRRGRLEGRGD